ncbi:MAG TPA: hypothetical protein VMW51_00785 [Terriglobia bacterium]|nr:hypothetical protein [Terriglobia bacterium]
MRRRGLNWGFLLAGVLGLAAAAAAGGRIPVGSLVGSKNATLDGRAPLPHTTVLSGDRLRVGNGLAMVALDQGNRMLLESGTDASFSRETDGVTVSMTQGSLSFFHPEAGTGFRMKAGGVTVSPAQGERALGEIALVNGLLLVTAKDGTLQVEKDGATQSVSKGKTLTLATAAAQSPTPTPSANSHPEHLLNHKTLVDLGIAAAGGGTALATIALTRASKQVSPVTPAP